MHARLAEGHVRQRQRRRRGARQVRAIKAPLVSGRRRAASRAREGYRVARNHDLALWLEDDAHPGGDLDLVGGPGSNQLAFVSE